MYSSSLPPGCTESMCEPDDPVCASCGDEYSAHFYEDGEEPFNRQDSCERNSDSDGVEYDSNGERVHACNVSHAGIQCTCEKYLEGEYEPDYDDYHGDLD